MRGAIRSTLAGEHRPVLLDETLTVLDPRLGQSVVDCTVGWAGHSAELLRRVGPTGRLIGMDLDAVNLDLIQINSYPGVHPFYGLGQLSGPQLTRLFPSRKRVTAGQMKIAREAWRAFRAGDPAGLEELTRHELTEMPFLKAALLRFLEEYPWTTDGLSRTERQILQAAAAGRRRRQDIYFESRKQEDVPWGDSSVYLRMDWLARGPNPALKETQPNEFEITDAGRQLLAGKADWIKLSGGIDRWLGGVHLTGTEPQWRWDPAKKTLVPSGSAV